MFSHNRTFPTEPDTRAAVSEKGPDWMQANKYLPTRPDNNRTTVWDPSWKKEAKIDLDRDSSVSERSPEWFRVPGVPICKRGGKVGNGLLTFEYGQLDPAESRGGSRNRSRQRAATASRSRRPTAAGASVRQRSRPATGRINSSRATSAGSARLSTRNDYYKAIDTIQNEQLNAARQRLAQLQRLSGSD